jgi:hypothetical protein
MDRPLVRAAESEVSKGFIAPEANSECHEARDPDLKDPGKLQKKNTDLE